MNTEIRQLYTEKEINEALYLSERVFGKFEASLCSAEGKKSFENFLYGDNMKQLRRSGNIHFFGAYRLGKLIGTGAVRNKNHISLLFVEDEYHRKGIGKALLKEMFEYVHKAFGINAITLNSSHYALPFYKAAGFVPTDMEMFSCGILYTPMVCTRAQMKY